MTWVLLYLYVIGVLNDFAYALSADADLKDWKVHVNIAAWPISVPLAIAYAIFTKDD